MLEKAYEMRDLLARHVKGETLSAEELMQLDQWLQAEGLDHEAVVRSNLRELARYTQQSALFNQSNRIPLPKVIRMNVLRMRIYRITAAAAVLIIIATAVFYAINRKPQPSGEQVTQNKPAVDIAPATAKAILTLADNSTIELGETGDGTIARQGSSIIRTSQGGLVYAPSSANGTASPLKPVGFNTVTTPEGGFYKVMLPDGSGVWLNAASSLKFPPVFSGNERAVELTGEGYFEIQHKSIAGGKRMPFLVRTGQGIIEVTGTRFNVNAYQDAHKQVTTLAEGAVTIHTLDDRFPARQLLPGQKAISIPEKAINIQPGNVQAATGWMNGWFTFENADIKEVMQQIARWYGVEIKYGNGIPAGPIMNGSIERNIPLSNLLTQLEATIGENLQFRTEGKQVFVSVQK